MNRTFTLLVGAIFLIAVAGFAIFFVPNEQPVQAPEDGNSDASAESIPTN